MSLEDELAREIMEVGNDPNNQGSDSALNIHGQGFDQNNGVDEEQESQDMVSSMRSPLDPEIEDYARFLGMDPEDGIDRQLMWIAK